MFLKKKKGSSLIATYVVIIVITLMAIAFVSGFSTKIWRAFFPSADKSTLKSFDAVYDILKSKSASTLDYDSTTMNVYLSKEYEILLFKNTEVYGDPSYGGSYQAKFYAPKDCVKDKRCLCLYKKLPKLKTVYGEEEDLVKCYTLEPTLDFESQYQAVNGIIGMGLDTNKYTSYIFVKRVIYPDKKAFLYVLSDTEENRTLNKEWSIPVCKTDKPDDLCFGKKEGDKVLATDVISRTKIYNYCSRTKADPKYKSLGVICEYPQGRDDCEPDCTYSEAKDLCKYSSCAEYNTLTREINYMTTVRYISPDDYKQYSLCEIDQGFCDVNQGVGCGIDTWQVYACRDSDSESGAADDPKSMESKDKANPECTPPWSYIVDPQNNAIDCEVKFLAYDNNKVQFFIKGLSTSLITGYNDQIEECKKYMTEYFYDKSTVMTCKQGKDAECKKFIDDKDDDCELKVIKLFERSGKEAYWLTHYSMIEDGCKEGITNLFTPVSLCRDKY